MTTTHGPGNSPSWATSEARSPWPTSWPRTARRRDDGHGCVGVHPGGDQPGGDRWTRRRTHQHDEGAGGPSQRVPIIVALDAVAADDGHLGAEPSLRDGDSGQRRCGQCRRHPGHDLDVEARLARRPHLLDAATEDERITTLESDDPAPSAVMEGRAGVRSRPADSRGLWPCRRRRARQSGRVNARTSGPTSQSYSTTSAAASNSSPDGSAVRRRPVRRRRVLPTVLSGGRRETRRGGHLHQTLTVRTEDRQPVAG